MDYLVPPPNGCGLCRIMLMDGCFLTYRDKQASKATINTKPLACFYLPCRLGVGGAGEVGLNLSPGHKPLQTVKY